jgi:EAL domain-containing protein (putative c-di-GMP-specific phosphodiesterase class I)
MYRVKRRGRGSWAFHGDPAPGGPSPASPEASAGPAITFELQRAASGGLRGVEARLAPGADEAEPAAARAERLLRQTAARAGELTDKPGSLIAVRVPGELWRAPHFAELAGDLRAAAGRLELLVDEADLIESPKRSSELLAELVRAGVAAVADGFGAGSTNLLALAQLPLSAVRLAPRLSGLAGTPEEGALRAAISAARSLELQVIAAGVETQQQRQRLAQLGCDAFQGGAISGALTRPAVEALLALER